MEHSFELLVDKVPYRVTAAPFSFNEQTRYRVTYNGGTDHIFSFDPSLGRLAPLDDDAGTMPDSLEVAIAERLQSGRIS